MAANTAFGISASVKRTAHMQMLTAAEQWGCVWVCGWVKLHSESSQHWYLLPAGCTGSLETLVTPGQNRRGHVLSPPSSTETEDVIKKSAHILCFCTLTISAGEKRELMCWKQGFPESTSSLRMKKRPRKEGSQDHDWQQEKILEMRDKRFMGMNPRNPGQCFPRLVTSRRGTTRINPTSYPT